MYRYLRYTLPKNDYFFMNLARVGGFNNQGVQNETPLFPDPAWVQGKNSCIIFYDLE